MPIYSLVALVLSIFGATYTSISAIRTQFSETVKNTKDVVKTQLGTISKASPDSKDDAQSHADKIIFWHKLWVWNHVVPIIFFWVTVFLIGICCFIWWESVIQPAARSDSSSQTNAPAIAAATSQPFLQASQNYIIPPDQICKKGRYVLGPVIFVNGACSILVICAYRTIKRRGQSLAELYKLAEKMLAEKNVAPADKKPPTGT